MQSVLRFLYPPQCLGCGEPVDQAHGLCGPCWRDTPFVIGLVCDQCGIPLPGDPGPPAEEPAQCDECLRLARPWERGRAALLYDGNARRMVLALKHGDRLDIARPSARWLADAASPLLVSQPLIVPVPLHWTRLLRRRFNQAAVLAGALARCAGLDHCPDLLIRTRRTPSQDGRDRAGRFGNVEAAIRPHPRRAHRAQGRRILLVDDVMTSGATLAAAADACLAAGALAADIVVLARVAPDT